MIHYILYYDTTTTPDIGGRKRAVGITGYSVILIHYLQRCFLSAKNYFGYSNRVRSLERRTGLLKPDTSSSNPHTTL